MLYGADDCEPPRRYAIALVDAAACSRCRVSFEIFDCDHHFVIRRAEVVAALVSEWAQPGDDRDR